MSAWSDLARLDLVVRPIERWPRELNPSPRWAPFRATLGDTLDRLERELRMLDAEQIVLQAAFRERDIRLDGLPRADARPEHPGIALTFGSKWGPLEYATDDFHDWQDNLRAIALSMEALRKVDRYGVSKRGEQYRGWRQLPTGSGDDDPVESLTFEQARSLLEELGGPIAALKRSHPDRGGTTEQFRLVQRAIELTGGRAIGAAR